MVERFITFSGVDLSVNSRVQFEQAQFDQIALFSRYYRVYAST